MFKNLKRGSTVFVLDKNKVEYLECSVISASDPKIDPQNAGSFIAEKVVDISFEVAGVQVDCTVPESKTFAEAKGGANNGLCISTNREDLCSEVKVMLDERAKIIANIDQYKKEHKALEAILVKVDPQSAKDKERDKRIDDLSGDVSELKGNMKEILTILKKKHNEA